MYSLHWDLRVISLLVFSYATHNYNVFFTLGFEGDIFVSIFLCHTQPYVFFTLGFESDMLAFSYATTIMYSLHWDLRVISLLVFSYATHNYNVFFTLGFEGDIFVSIFLCHTQP